MNPSAINQIELISNFRNASKESHTDFPVANCVTKKGTHSRTNPQSKNDTQNRRADALLLEIDKENPPQPLTASLEIMLSPFKSYAGNNIVSALQQKTTALMLATKKEQLM